MSDVISRHAKVEGSCAAIAAVFVYGPQRCGVVAGIQVLEMDEWFYVCDEHASDLGITK